MPKNIKIYTNPTCPHCVSAKAYLDQKGIEYENIDVSTDPAAVKEMVAKSKQMGVPVIIVDDEVVIGFDQPKLDKLLNE